MRKKMMSVQFIKPGVHPFGVSAKIIAMIAFCVLFAARTTAQDKKLWLTAGQNSDNTRNASQENKISVASAGKLAVKWAFTTGGDVSANPAVDEQFVYFPDWAGNLYKVDASTGAQAWRKEIKSYTGQTSAFARATPALSGNTLVIGTQLGFPASGAYVLAINKTTGDLLWRTQVDAHPASIVTQGAIVYANKVYVGVASQEEAFAADPNYPCCSFRGSFQCLDLTTGQVLWKTYVVPGVGGFSGNAVWGSTPVIDPSRNSVYISTGNNYTVPQAILDCVGAGGTSSDIRACIATVNGSAQNYFDALVSMDLNTGAIKWAKSVIPFDAWTVACFFDGPNCPDNAGPDYDFGQGPALFTVGKGSNKRQLLGAGQKSGIYWALDPDNGNEVWHTQVGPGGTLGGLQWGSAVDDKQVYTAISNNYFIPHLMTKGPGAGNTVNGGFWAALNSETGAVNWEYAASNPPAAPAPPGAVAYNTGMVTIANGVMFGGAMDAAGTMYAFDAATGKKLWSFASGGSVNSGPAVVEGSVYWGSGYSNFGLGSANNKMYAFYLPKNNAAPPALVVASNPLEKDAEAAVTVYPSPAKDMMQIVSRDNSKILSVRLFDLSGRLVRDFKLSGSSSYTLNLGTVAAGTYMINISTATKNSSSRIIVTH